MSAVRTYKDLIAWQKAMTLVEGTYRLAKLLPSHERFELMSQLRRAAVSVPCNIAEGFGRCTKADFLRFLDMALGSTNELETQLLICLRLGYIEQPKINPVSELCREVQKVLKGLIVSINERGKTTVRD